MSVQLLSYTGLRTLYGNNTNSSSTGHLDRGMEEMNTKYLELCNAKDWPFLEELATLTTVADQQAYDLPADVDIVKTVSVDVGTTRYTTESIDSWKEWELINSTVDWSSAFPKYHFVYNDQIYLWPVPSTASYDMRIVYRKRPVRLQKADYTTGTITSITNGAKVVTGNGTTWTDKMEGEYIVIHDSFDDNTGDGKAYKIASVDSATQITLERNYQGTTIAAGTADYTIGQVPLIPQEYAHILVYWASYVYWASQDNGQSRAQRFAEMYAELLNQMINEQQSRARGVNVEPVSDLKDMLNPNLYIDSV